jgi:methyl-accepting chemotaxis protein
MSAPISNEAASALGEIGGIIRDIFTLSEEISSAVNQQNTATDEISHNVQEAAQGTEDVPAQIMKMKHGIKETNQGAKGVLKAASALDDQSRSLKQGFEEFLSSVRSA